MLWQCLAVAWLRLGAGPVAAHTRQTRRSLLERCELLSDHACLLAPQMLPHPYKFASPPAGFPFNTLNDLIVRGFSVLFLDCGGGTARRFFLIFGRPALRAPKSRADAPTTSHDYYLEAAWTVCVCLASAWRWPCGSPHEADPSIAAGAL